MKLLQKTNQVYFLISASAFIIAGVTFYFVISFFFKDQINEKLHHDIKNITKSIKSNGAIPDYYPFIEIKEVSGLQEHSYKTIDTMVFDIYEKRKLPYRQISVITVINGKEYSIVARDTFLEQDDLLEIIALVTGSVFALLLISLYFINRKLSLK